MRNLRDGNVPFFYERKKHELGNIILFFEQAVFWFGTVVAAASVIIKATPTQKDDAVLAKIIKVLDLVSIVNAKIQENKETSQKEKNAA